MSENQGCALLGYGNDGRSLDARTRGGRTGRNANAPLPMLALHAWRRYISGRQSRYGARRDRVCRRNAGAAPSVSGGNRIPLPRRRKSAEGRPWHGYCIDERTLLALMSPNDGSDEFEDGAVS